jgi:hypothetical protein
LNQPKFDGLGGSAFHVLLRSWSRAVSSRMMALTCVSSA